METSEFDFPDAPLDLLSEVFSKHIHSIFEESIRVTRIPNITEHPPEPYVVQR